MRGTRAALSVAVGIAAAVVFVSGGTGVDPRTPAGVPGVPPPFLGVAVVGDGGRTAAVDAYGNLVDVRAPGPAGRALVAVDAERQAAGTVPADAAVVARVRVGGRSMPLWRADAVRQHYLPGTNVLRTVARFGEEQFVVVRSIGGPAAARADRRWVARARALGSAAPGWAQAMYERSLLVLRTLTDRRTGAVAAGARDGWAHVWPRDAAAVGVAFAAAGYRPEARRVARFLLGLDLGAAARFDGAGAPVEGRAAQGDAAGWVVAAARAAGLRASTVLAEHRHPSPAPAVRAHAFSGWTDRADYHEGDPGDYLSNAIASGLGTADLGELFGTPRGLAREAGDPGSGLESAAAWAVRPFARPALYPAARRTLHHLLAGSRGRFGLLPAENWAGGEDPWTATTAWTAWALAALAREGGGSPGGTRDRRAALRLIAALRRAATPAGMLPERVDAQTGVPRSTTPLAWSHAFAILAIRELWPGRAGS